MVWVLVARKAKQHRDERLGVTTEPKEDGFIKKTIKTTVGGVKTGVASLIGGKEEQTTSKQELAQSGKDLLRSALEKDNQQLLCIKDHLINENEPSNKRYEIISIPKNVIVILIEGDVRTGLPEPLHDFIKVKYNNKIGIVSKFCFIESS